MGFVLVRWMASVCGTSSIEFITSVSGISATCPALMVIVLFTGPEIVTLLSVPVAMNKFSYTLLFPAPAPFGMNCSQYSVPDELTPCAQEQGAGSKRIETARKKKMRKQNFMVIIC